MMPFNENSLRISKIKKFIGIYEKFIDCHDEILKNEVSRLTPEISSYIRESGTGTIVNDPNTGPYDMFENILDKRLANPNRIVDRLYSCLGTYQFRQKTLKRKLINPLFWVGEIIRIPFHILKYSGFDPTKLETSWVGKAYKFIAAFLAFVLLVLHILSQVGVDTKIFTPDKKTQNSQQQEPIQ